MTNIDPFTKSPIIRQGIWTDTQCLAKESETLNAVITQVEQHGYVKSADNHRVWTLGTKKIVICLVDDVRSATHDYETDTPYLFDRNTLVITDNYFGSPTQFQVFRLPHSFFGIYAHDQQVEWKPDREYCFSVNRLDDRRFKLMLELGKRAHLSQGYVNFNCQIKYFRLPQVPDHAELQANFEQYWSHLGPDDADRYRSSFDMLRQLMPYRNYEQTHEQIHAMSRCNMIVESYGSDTTVAFSEKIFRALQVPVPWTVYAGHYAVAYLESMGFDCMSDIINHNHYDQLKEIEDKIRIFIWFSLKFARESSQLDQPELAKRCQQAADHNQNLLQQYQHTWQDEFQDWLDLLGQRLDAWGR